MVNASSPVGDRSSSRRPQANASAGHNRGEALERAAFTAALVADYLATIGANPTSAHLVEASLTTGRGKAVTPPLPDQQPESYYPGLTAAPWHDPASFEWVPTLEAASPAIRVELAHLLDEGAFDPTSLSGELAETGSWKELRFYTDGRAHADTLELAPVTASAIAAIPGAMTAGVVYAAAVTSGTHIRPHWGPHNARLRAHLGLVVPSGCRIRVGPVARTWQEGRVLIFDDSFEHEVWHRGDGTRLVLIVDVWHPDLSADDIAAIRYARTPFIPQAFQVARSWAHTGQIRPAVAEWGDP